MREMKFIRKIYKSFIRLKLRVLTRKAVVSLRLDRLFIAESELKQLLVENGDTFSKLKLKSCTYWNWKSEPLALLKSKIEMQAEFALNLSERLVYLFVPGMILAQKKNHLETQFVKFFGIASNLPNPSEQKSSILKSFLKTPRSMHLSSLIYKCGTIPVDANFHFNLIEGGHPILQEGKLQCFVRLFQLQKIEYFWNSRIFVPPAPFVGEIYIKVKERYRNGGLGQTQYVFQGRFLLAPKDNYFLEYWGLGPCVRNEILRMLPEELTNLPSLLYLQERSFKEARWEHCPCLTVERVKDLMYSGDRVSTF
jgi:hypothetical protein